MTGKLRKELARCAEERMSEKRFLHTESVAREAVELGRIYLPEDLDGLETAAWLHDITKDLDHGRQLQLCGEFGIMLDKYRVESPGVLHAITGAETAAALFPDLVTGNVKSAIRYHTTGREDMTVFESLIYLADYIEPTRRHESCRKLREYFYSDVSGKDMKEHLADTMIKSFDMTVGYLLESGSLIDPDTISARNWFVRMKNGGLFREFQERLQ